MVLIPFARLEISNSLYEAFYIVDINVGMVGIKVTMKCIWLECF